MSLEYLNAAAARGDTETLIRHVRLHVGDGDEAAGRREIDKAWVQAPLPLLDLPEVDRELVLNTLQTPASTSPGRCTTGGEAHDDSDGGWRTYVARRGRLDGS
jgi:hypothetical protein